LQIPNPPTPYKYFLSINCGEESPNGWRNSAKLTTAQRADLEYAAGALRNNNKVDEQKRGRTNCSSIKIDPIDTYRMQMPLASWDRDTYRYIAIRVDNYRKVSIFIDKNDEKSPNLIIWWTASPPLPPLPVIE
jgi:hypothetical protein